LTESLGRELIEALAKGDFERVRGVLHPEVHLRGLTPGKFDEAKGDAAVDRAIEIFKLWFFEDEDHLESVEWCDVQRVGRGARWKLSFGLRGKSPGMSDRYAAAKRREIAADADWIVEQEAYFEVRDGKIAWMIMLCGGYHPADEFVAYPRMTS
jgi:hypothetical protein